MILWRSKGRDKGVLQKSNMQTYRTLSNKLKSNNPSIHKFLQIAAQIRDENILMHLTLKHTHTQHNGSCLRAALKCCPHYRWSQF